MRFYGLGYNQAYAAIQAAQLVLDYFEISTVGDRPVKWFEDMYSSDFGEIPDSGEERLTCEAVSEESVEIVGNSSYSTAKDVFDSINFNSKSFSKSFDDSDF